MRRTKRLRGESYSSTTGKIMPEKKFVPVLCECFKKCHNFVPELKQRELNSKLYINIFDLITLNIFLLRFSF